jgi:HPt (histidine-containing phosphotransfer) domain-containing protein
VTESLLDLPALQELEAHIGRARLERIVDVQLRHGRSLIEKLAALEPGADPQAVRLFAHQIAGSCGAVGMTVLSEAATSLEILAQSGTAGDLFPAAEALRQLATASHDALEAAFANAG